MGKVGNYCVHYILPVLFILWLPVQKSYAQVPLDSVPPGVVFPLLGPNDTIPVQAMVADNTLYPINNLDWIWVQAPMPASMRRRIEEWTRLRNAVYVTYPYARKASIIMNDIRAKTANMTEENRKLYIQSREKDLKREFTTPLTNLSVYQGKVLMKLINRQTGNSCYDIVKEYKGGVSARFWQTVAFFFGSSLKQPYDPQGDDKQIESIVIDLEKMYGYRS